MEDSLSGLLRILTYCFLSLGIAINCLTTALSVSPPSTCVNNMLLGELSTGSSGGQLGFGILYTLFRHSEQFCSPSISLEAFQALKALAHNYPNVIILCWKQVSSVVSGVFSFYSEASDVYSRLWKGNTENSTSQMRERVMAAAIKVLDECLRAISGFKGIEDLSNNEFLDSPFMSDYVKTKTISSAPLYSLEIPTSTEFESKARLLKSEEWFEATVKHLPIIIKHISPMVRAASVTCFAGLTSSVFFSLPKDKQDFVISSLIDTALNDESPSVRSAACRAIGIVACFPLIYHRTSDLENFFHALKHNALDSLVSVRVTASWALANICNAIGYYTDATESVSIDSGRGSEFMLSLVACALQLARDNDKVKANAVRALGNLSRFIHFTNLPHVHGDLVDFVHLKVEDNGPIDGSSTTFHSPSTVSAHWLEQMVQTFLSCVTTGNVKVQWNVCHALSNLFFNRTLKLQDWDWSASVFSVLLLLLRDSSNFKIRIQAAAALAVPKTLNDYGRSYYDIVKTVAQVFENFKSSQISDPTNFKYLIALEKQLTSTMLHLLGLASRCDHKAIHDFLIMKAMFLEAWIEDLCSSLGETSQEVTRVMSMEQKKDMIIKTILSLIQVFENSNHHVLAEKFCQLHLFVKNL